MDNKKKKKYKAKNIQNKDDVSKNMPEPKQDDLGKSKLSVKTFQKLLLDAILLKDKDKVKKIIGLIDDEESLNVLLNYRTTSDLDKKNSVIDDKRWYRKNATFISLALVSGEVSILKPILNKVLQYKSKKELMDWMRVKNANMQSILDHVGWCNDEIFDELYEEIKPLLTTEDLNSFLSSLISHGHMENSKKLLDDGADINDPRIFSSLEYAIDSNYVNPNFLNLLSDYGLNLKNYRDNIHMNLLHRAMDKFSYGTTKKSIAQDIEILDYLISKGLNPYLKDENDKIPIEYGNYKEELKKRLKDYMDKLEEADIKFVYDHLGIFPDVEFDSNNNLSRETLNSTKYYVDLINNPYDNKIKDLKTYKFMLIYSISNNDKKLFKYLINLSKNNDKFKETIIDFKLDKSLWRGEPPNLSSKKFFSKNDNLLSNLLSFDMYENSKFLLEFMEKNLSKKEFKKFINKMNGPADHLINAAFFASKPDTLNLILSYGKKYLSDDEFKNWFMDDESHILLSNSSNKNKQIIKFIFDYAKKIFSDKEFSKFINYSTKNKVLLNELLFSSDFDVALIKELIDNYRIIPFLGKGFPFHDSLDIAKINKRHKLAKLLEDYMETWPEYWILKVIPVEVKNKICENQKSFEKFQEENKDDIETVSDFLFNLEQCNNLQVTNIFSAF